MRKKGWLKIDGLQDGDRTLQEQMLGLDKALSECKGATVIDLGCAEGAIGIEFAKAGAINVVGYDYKKEFIQTANYLAEINPDLPVEFHHADLSLPRNYGEFDIVLALAILHKLPNPREGLELCMRIAKKLIVIRLPIGSKGMIRSKHAKHMHCDLTAILMGNGWIQTENLTGARGEIVQYWRPT
jgi:2-polyprenyl-3-methyl-5-hydroxy-6-metoxy-1,4-benzoquinol methylase